MTREELQEELEKARKRENSMRESLRKAHFCLNKSLIALNKLSAVEGFTYSGDIPDEMLDYEVKARIDFAKETLVNIDHFVTNKVLN